MVQASDERQRALRANYRGKLQESGVNVANIPAAGMQGHSASVMPADRGAPSEALDGGAEDAWGA